MLKKTLAVAAAAIMAATVHASAGEAKDEGHKHRVHPKAERMMERMDRDGNGRVEAAEFMAPMNDRAQIDFGRMDTDGDGAVSADEFRAAATARAAEAFSRMDRNSDGRITKEDFRAMKAMKKGMRAGKEGKSRHGHAMERNSASEAPAAAPEVSE